MSGAAPAPELRPEGRLEGIEQGVAVGWARDPARPGEALAVELLCDGYPVALDRAEIFRPDLGHADGEAACCGFQITVPGPALETGRVLAARLANTGRPLAGALRLGEGEAGSARRRPLGEVRGGDTLRLTGWIRPAGFEPLPLTVRAEIEGGVVAETLADRPLPAAGDGAGDPLARGFALDLPLALADGAPHAVHVTDARGNALRGSPVTLAAVAEGADAVLAELAARRDLPADAARRIGLLHAVMARQAAHAPGFAAFAAYPRWRALARPGAPVSAPAGPEPAALLLHGAAPDEGAAAAAQGLPVIHARDGAVPAEALPAGGAVIVLAAGDRLMPGAASRLAAALAEADLAYADTEQEVGGSACPWFRPAWDPDLYLAQGYVFGALAVRAEALRRAAGEGARGPGALVTAVLARAAPGRVRHLPEILARQPGAPAEGAPPLPPDWPERALAFWPEIAAGRARRTALPGAPWLGRVRRPLPEPAPRVAVLIPTRDRVELLSRAVDTLTGMTDYPALEPIVLDNATTCPRARAYLADLPGRGVRVLDCPGPFNFAAINNRGVAATDADLVCLLNNDVEITEPGWLAEMVSALARPEIGAVGAKLLWDTGMVQHAGVVLGIDGGAAHAGPLWAAEDRGYCGANRLARRVSAVTAACLLLRRADYRAVGGMDADAFPVNFNDVDLCMKLGALGKAVLWTPHALMLHHESASRGRDALPARAARARRELEMLRRRWGRTLLADPYYNPNLTRRGEPYAGLALPPAPATPR